MQAVTLPNGRSISLGSYVWLWKNVKARDPRSEVTGWQWYPVPARDVLRDLRHGLQDRINQRGGLVVRTASENRIKRQLRARVTHECRWCGSDLGRYAEREQRFCDADCRRNHWG
jgi:hypothetical protein